MRVHWRDSHTIACAALGLLFGMPPAQAAEDAKGPSARPDLPNSELVLMLSLELSNEPGNASTVVGRAVRTNWREAGDLAEAQASIGNLRKDAFVKYTAPTTRGSFTVVSNELRYSDTQQYITENTLYGFRDASYRNLWLAPSRLGLWGVGWGVEYVRLDTPVGIAPFLVDYVAQQGQSTTAVPLIAYWANDRRVAGGVVPSGHSGAILAEWGTPAGSIEYARFDMNYQAYLAMGQKASIGFNVTAGRVVGLKGDLSPYNKRFLGGGVGSVRGYEFGALSPTDPSGAATGADSKATIALEALWNPFNIGATPIVLSVFFDQGRFAGPDYGAISEVNASSYGVGLSLPMRWGLMRVYYARPQDEEFRTQNFQFEARASW